jgi:hypothetical protein
MAINLIRGRSDRVIEAIKRTLDEYQRDNPEAVIELYRQNSASVRVRIINPKFAKMDRVERNDELWSYLKRLPPRPQSDISMLLLLAPNETRSSLINLEFEDPIPSRL